MDMSEVLNLYVVVDRISKKTFTGIIPAENDLVAVFGFIKWLKSQKDGIDQKCYSLCRIGSFSAEGKILDMDNYPVVTGDRAQEFYDNEIVKALEEEEN